MEYWLNYTPNVHIYASANLHNIFRILPSLLPILTVIPVFPTEKSRPSRSGPAGARQGRKNMREKVNIYTAGHEREAGGRRFCLPPLLPAGRKIQLRPYLFRRPCFLCLAYAVFIPSSPAGRSRRTSPPSSGPGPAPPPSGWCRHGGPFWRIPPPSRSRSPA